MFRKVQEPSLDEPLLARDNDDDEVLQTDAAVPLVTNVGVLGMNPGKGYSKVVDDDESERAEQEAKERAERLNALALEKQKKNQASFEQDMTELEEKIIREAKEKQRLEENDRLLALRLQQEEGGGAEGSTFHVPETTTMMVQVPQGSRGGQMVAVQVPGKGLVNILIPQGLKPGDKFNFKIPTPVSRGPRTNEAQFANVRIPRGVAPGGSFRVILPNNRMLTVGVPAGVREGDEIRVRFDDHTGVPYEGPSTNPTAPSPNAQNNEYIPSPEDEALAVQESIEEVTETEAQRAEREAFLAALPEEVRREVMAQETAQKRRLSQYKNPPPTSGPSVGGRPSAPNPTLPPLTADQMAFLSTLPEELRAEVEQDLRVENANKAQQLTQSRQQDEDLLGIQNQTQSPASAPPVDMFQNLSVKGKEKSKAQQI